MDESSATIDELLTSPESAHRLAHEADQSKQQFNSIVKQLINLGQTIYRESDKYTKIYCGGCLVVFVLLCILMRHPAWIITVFWDNLIGDINSSTPQLLSGLMNSTGEGFWSTLFLSIPSALQFSFLSGFFSDLIQLQNYPDNFAHKVVMFLGNYFLMSIIALAWAPPVTLEMLIHSKVNAIIVIVWCIFTIWTVIRHDMFYLGRIASFTGLILAVAAQELIKTIIIALIFAYVSSLQQGGRDWSSLVGIIVSLFLSLGPFCYIVINQFLGPIISKVTATVVGYITNEDLGLEFTQAGAWFGIIVVVISLLGGIVLHFV